MSTTLENNREENNRKQNRTEILTRFWEIAVFSIGYF